MTDVKYTWEEIALFAVMLASCLAIVIYFACKRTNFGDYVSGGGKLGVWPLSMSMIATSLSSITFGYANDIYQFGPHIMLQVISIGVLWIVCWILIPTLHPLKLSSLNDYGAMRFNKYVKLFMSISILIYMNLHATVVTYSTSLFISQISGLGFMKCFLIIIISCYILTSIGGFKGVVWTDTILASVMFASVASLAAIGLKEVGGLDQVYKAAYESDRLRFDWSLDSKKRLTVWSALVAFSVQRASTNSIAVPSIYQRYAALPTLSDARKTSVIHILGIEFITIFTFFLGYIMLTLFKDCDPVLSGKAVKYDQVLPFFIGYVGEQVRLARCVYIIGYVSASVSTLSTEMNTFAVTLYKDFIHDGFNKENRTVFGQRMIQLAGLLLVILSILLVQTLQHSKSVTDLAAILCIPSTIYVSIVLIGIFMPWIGSKGILWATFISLLTMTWISIGSRMAHSEGLINYPVKPMSVNGCSNPNASNITEMITLKNDPYVFILFKVTPFLQSPMGLIIMILVSILVTLITGSNDLGKLDRRLLSPWVRRFLPKPIEKDGEELMPLSVLSADRLSVAVTERSVA